MRRTTPEPTLPFQASTPHHRGSVWPPKVIGPLFFAETSVTAHIYLDMYQNYAVLQMQYLQPIDIFQQDAGARMLEHFAATGLPAGYPQNY
ncbi:hypothetical protein AVEN_85862-1 [Araneus ventricosus]|uniref:Uncharacterized protein n=1 Tax=Araneus ventricosus TaxID=182803 RepID=A0A4Y2KQF4_ARAVE|nr:hypothetical protein AVEN_85862-1 [Araneus ventricosus]